MSYQEENGAVVLRMSKADYNCLLIYLGFAHGASLAKGPQVALNTEVFLEFLNRLNEGNPNYTPYQVKP